MDNKHKYQIKNITKIIFLLFSCIIGLISCKENGKLKFDPVLNKVYHFSLAKYSVKSWTYQSIPVRIPDTVYMNFSLQNIERTDSSITCRLTLNTFIWPGNIKVNYKKDSLHALSTLVVLSDSGKVKYVHNTNEIFQDILNDSATGKYLKGIIPDQISVDAITDMLNRIFSVIPVKKVRAGDNWVSDICLITNHTVNISNFNVLKNLNGDTATVEIQSNIIAIPSPGADPYIQGNQKGSAVVSYSTGIPFWYSTQSEIVTTTSYYDITQEETFILKRE